MENKTKDIILAVLITIVAVIIALWIIGSAETRKEENEAKQNEELAFKGQLRDSFMGECVADGLYEACNCAFNALYDKVGAEGMLRLEKETGYNDGEITQEIENIIREKKCFDLVK